MQYFQNVKRQSSLLTLVVALTKWELLAVFLTACSIYICTSTNSDNGPIHPVLQTKTWSPLHAAYSGNTVCSYRWFISVMNNRVFMMSYYFFSVYMLLSYPVLLSPATIALASMLQDLLTISILVIFVNFTLHYTG